MQVFLSVDTEEHSRIPLPSVVIALGCSYFGASGAVAPALGCLAMIMLLILLYVASGMIFLLTRSRFVRYGRPSMIFCEYASPIPGRALSWSLVAVLRSSLSVS